MNPDQNNQQSPPPDSDQPSFLVETSPTTNQLEPLAQPKNYKKIFMIAGIVIAAVAIITVIIFVIIMAVQPKNTESAVDAKPTTEQTKSPTEEITSGLVESADNETKLTDTDDTQSVEDASKTAGNVEDGINEENF